MAIGVSDYDHLTNLQGPIRDLDLIEGLLCDNPLTALIPKARFHRFQNPTSGDVRQAITQFVVDRSAERDVLVFYFSGHGSPISFNDFAFCLRDTRSYPDKRVLPSSALRLSDLLETLSVMNVIPIIVADTCFSGHIGPSTITAHQTVEIVRASSAASCAGSYCLACACSANETAKSRAAGVFTEALVATAARGLADKIGKRKRQLSLQDLFAQIDLRVSNLDVDMNARFYVGPTLPHVDFVKNAAYAPRVETLTPYLVELLRWIMSKGGCASTDSIRKHTAGSYGNHSKLSYPQWRLLKDGKTRQERIITKRGRRFLRNELTVPNRICQQANGSWRPARDARRVHARDI